MINVQVGGLLLSASRLTECIRKGPFERLARTVLCTTKCNHCKRDFLLDTINQSDDDLLMSLASIQKEISQLDAKERAMLIDLLWESLDEESILEIQTKWASESEDRIDAFERGELPAVDGPTALQELRSSLRK